MKNKKIIIIILIIFILLLIPLGLFIYNRVSIDNFLDYVYAMDSSEREVIEILNKEENEEKIKNIAKQVQKATKHIKNQSELENIIVPNNIITNPYVNSPSHELIRESFKINGVNLDDDILIKSIVYIEKNDASANVIPKRLTIKTPNYISRECNTNSSIKGGWFLPISIPVMDKLNCIGMINITLDITDIPKVSTIIDANPPVKIKISVDKPVIYLYPKEKQDVKVELDYDGELYVTYPLYNEKIKGWDVIAYPDGKIINKEDNLEYSYIFWDGFSDKVKPKFETGYIVKKEDTQMFLQDILPKMGLTPKEYNEFIVYWLPLMVKNEYNVIEFLEEEYTNVAKLNITPKPDSILRVFMAYKGVDEEEAKKIKATIKEPKINEFKRNGFTVIEWGGMEVSK